MATLSKHLPPPELLEAIEKCEDPKVLGLFVMPDGYVGHHLIAGNLKTFMLSNLCDEEGNPCAEPVDDGAGLFHGGNVFEIISNIFDMSIFPTKELMEDAVIRLVVPYNTTPEIPIPPEAQGSFSEMIDKAMPLVEYLERTDPQNASQSSASIRKEFEKDCGIVVSYRQADVDNDALLIIVSVDYRLSECQVTEALFSPASTIGLPMTSSFLGQIDIENTVRKALQSGGPHAAHALLRWNMAFGHY